MQDKFKGTSLLHKLYWCSSLHKNRHVDLYGHVYDLKPKFGSYLEDLGLPCPLGLQQVLDFHLRALVHLNLDLLGHLDTERHKAHSFWLTNILMKLMCRETNSKPLCPGGPRAPPLPLCPLDPVLPISPRGPGRP